MEPAAGASDVQRSTVPGPRDPHPSRDLRAVGPTVWVEEEVEDDFPATPEERRPPRQSPSGPARLLAAAAGPDGGSSARCV